MVRQEEIQSKIQNLLMLAGFIPRISIKGVCAQGASIYYRRCETLGDNL
jgi:hypothetical protein